MMVGQVTLSYHDMTCHSMKALTLLLNTVHFPASFYPTKVRNLNYDVF